MAPLPTEIALLAWTLILAIVHIMAAGQARTKQYGTTWNMGARDEQMPPLDPVPARLLRAQANLFETLPLFAAAVLAATTIGRLGPLTLVGSHLYFWGRLIYLPLYAAGIPKIRTFVWLASALGLVLVIAGLLFG